MLDSKRPWLQDPVGSNPNGEQARKPSGKGDRFNQHHAFVVATMRTLNRTEALVWNALWDFTDARTGLVALSHTALAELVGCHRRTAIRAVQSLMKKGLVKRTKKGSNLTNLSSVYQVCPTAKAEKG
jgi:hypothetical protein